MNCQNVTDNTAPEVCKELILTLPYGLEERNIKYTEAH